MVVLMSACPNQSRMVTNDDFEKGGDNGHETALRVCALALSALLEHNWIIHWRFLCWKWLYFIPEVRV